MWTSPRTRERWQVFACAVHVDRLVDDPECRDIGPLDDTAVAELADRRERWEAAPDGRGWRLPQPVKQRRRHRGHI